jgi:hypothetical protein
MNNQEIIDSEPPKQGKWTDCNQVDSNGKWSHRQPIIRSLADIKRIVELEACLIKIRELLAGQKDKSCLGTGYPSNENDCSPWPIVDEAVNNITQALKVGIKQ